MGLLSLTLCIVATALMVLAQPSPEVQERISAAIAAAANQTNSTIDYTAFVNPFIGTGELTLCVIAGQSQAVFIGRQRRRCLVSLV